MDDKNLASITEAANDNKIDISPVGSVIRYLREQDEEFIPYISDDSHLNDSGTFAAACTFYTIIFKKDPTLITFNGGLEQHVADAIKAATKTVVYDNLNKWTNDAVETGLQSFARMGVTDENLSMQVLLSPNPAKEYTQVTFSMPIKNCRLDVLNTVGEKFEVPYSFNGKTMDLDLSDLINGIYLIKLSSDNFQTIKKIIVEK